MPQVYRLDNGTMMNKAIFSLWDASDTVLTMPMPGCNRFGGEGTGSQCIITYSLVQGQRYNVHVFMNGGNASGAFLSGTITDVRSNKETKIGTHFLPNYAGYKGYGNLQVNRSPAFRMGG